MLPNAAICQADDTELALEAAAAAGQAVGEHARTRAAQV